MNSRNIVGVALAGAFVVAASGCTSDPDPRYRIGGRVTGLAGSGLVLHSSLGDDLPIAAEGGFSFATRARVGEAYSVTVAQQPAAQRCAVTGGADGRGGGTVAAGDVTSVVVSCADVVVQRWEAPATWGPVWQDDGNMVQHAYFGSTDGSDTTISEEMGIAWDVVNGPLPPPRRLDAFPSGTRWGAGPFAGPRLQATAGDSALDLPRDMLVCAIVKPDWNPNFVGDGKEKGIVAKGVGIAMENLPGGGWVLMQMHAQFCFHYQAIDAQQVSRVDMTWTPTYFADQKAAATGPLNPSWVVVCAGRSGDQIRIAANDHRATDLNTRTLKGVRPIVLDSSGNHRATIGGYDTDDPDHWFPGRVYETAVWDEPATPENIQAKFAAVQGLSLGAGDTASATYTRNREGPWVGIDGRYHTAWRHGPRIDPVKGFLFGLQAWNRVSYCRASGIRVSCDDPAAVLAVAAGEELERWTRSAGAVVQRDQLEPPGDSEKPTAELVTLTPGASLSTPLGAFDTPGPIHGQLWIRTSAGTLGTLRLATGNPAAGRSSQHDVDLGALAPDTWTRIWLDGLTTDGAAGTLTMTAAAANPGPVTFHAWGVHLTQLGGGGDLGAFDPGPAMYDWSARIGVIDEREQDHPEHTVDVLELPPVPASTAWTGFCLSVEAQPADGLDWNAPFAKPRGLAAWLHDRQPIAAQLLATGGDASELCFSVTGASLPACWRPDWAPGTKHAVKGCLSPGGALRLYADGAPVATGFAFDADFLDLADGHVAVGNRAGADPATWSFAGQPSPWHGYVSRAVVCRDLLGDGAPGCE